MKVKYYIIPIKYLTPPDSEVLNYCIDSPTELKILVGNDSFEEITGDIPTLQMNFCKKVKPEVLEKAKIFLSKLSTEDKEALRSLLYIQE